MPTSIQALEFSFQVVKTRTRFPFKYGIASMTEAPHVFFRCKASFGRKRQIGISAEGLPPKWFTKIPDTSFEDDLPAMYHVIKHAAEAATEIKRKKTFYEWWRDLYDAQNDWAKSQSIPPLLAHLGTSLVERAMLDAFGRFTERPFADSVRQNALGVQLGDIHPQLVGRQPTEFLPQPTPLQIIARHTIGLGDPLSESDGPENPDDGLPFTLEECIEAYGLTHFKIKISGNLEWDRERLQTIHKILKKGTPAFRFTLDGNEQFQTPSEFSEYWGAISEDSTLRDFLSGNHLIFIEQPIHRDRALSESFESWDGPALIIDESDGELDSTPRALDLGYSGSSHKNCKGVMKGIANACLLKERKGIQSGEDLGNIGPVALLQDLAVMQTLGIEHVERNGHHYFRGLSMFSDEIQQMIWRRHGDLYRRHEDDFPTLNLRNGGIDSASVAQSGFGVGIDLDPVMDWRDISELGN
ncbi:MAG: hypothetical protein ACI8UO_002297 [Verrucomicrobiales bacterium]|jgi:hypothetical protein